MDPAVFRLAHHHTSRLSRLSYLAAPLAAGLLACGALLAVLGGWVPPAWAAVAQMRNFPGTGPCATSLQDCIDGASPGDTIVIQTGVYTVGLNLAQRVNLTGVSSATVFLNALANQRVLTVTGAAIDSGTIISGLTLSGGHPTGAACPDGCGGAIFIGDSAQPQLINLTLRDNQADGNGGGGAVYADVVGPLMLSGVALLSNTATTGHAGGVYATDQMIVADSFFQNNKCLVNACYGGALTAFGNMTVTNSIFLSNSSGRGGGGALSYFSLAVSGGLFQFNQCTAPSACEGGGPGSLGHLVLAGTRVLSNVSTSGGGGAFANANATVTGVLFQGNVTSDAVGGGLSANGRLVATNTQFISNTAVIGGGGVFAGISLTMTGGLFQDNVCTALSCKGGGLWSHGGMALTNTQFLNNHGQQGGGLYQDGSADGRLVNTLFGGNFADDNGQALFLTSSGQVTSLHTTIASPAFNAGSAVFLSSGTANFTNTLFANAGVAIENSSGTAFEDYSLFSNVTTLHGGVVSGGLNSHPGAAGFVDPGQNNYHLASGSAAIDAGVNAGINFDIDGQPRPAGGGYDIGADEFRPTLYLPVVRK